MATLKSTDYLVTLRCKVAVCGDAAVGKTALMSMFTSKGLKFPKAYNMTSGVDVVVAQVPIPEKRTTVELYLLDTAGNDLYKEQISQYWNGVYYAILVFDVGSMDSFESCKAWFELLKSARPDRERAMRAVLVANKVDLPPQRHQVRSDMAADWAANNGVEFFQCSAVPPGQHYEAPFMSLATAFQAAYDERLDGFAQASRGY